MARINFPVVQLRTPHVVMETVLSPNSDFTSLNPKNSP